MAFATSGLMEEVLNHFFHIWAYMSCLRQIHICADCTLYFYGMAIFLTSLHFVETLDMTENALKV